ncbi:MAG: hypothetical protein LBG77_08460 [Dysgonamonadaceae bacterium]|jgi:hypothetical protein|nr:hypothetical protein [Dysgonamonadaceae bacterium]
MNTQNSFERLITEIRRQKPPMNNANELTDSIMEKIYLLPAIKQKTPRLLVLIRVCSSAAAVLLLLLLLYQQSDIQSIDKSSAYIYKPEISIDCEPCANINDCILQLKSRQTSKTVQKLKQKYQYSSVNNL